MSILAHLCIRLGILPRRRWFVDYVQRTMFVPLHPRDDGSGMDGYLSLGGNLGPARVARWRDWWIATRR